jgi:putative PIN family toxin of toxin-antitoxin system
VTLRFVLDTNVLVSGLLGKAGPPRQIVDALLAGQILAVLEPRVLAEYAEVLRRPRLRILPVEADTVLEFLSHDSEFHDFADEVLPFDMPDADDAPFAQLALYARVDALVTGNGKHFTAMSAHGTVPVFTPAEAVELMRA